MDKSAFKNLTDRASAHPKLADMEVVEALGPWPLPLYSLQQRTHYLAVGFTVRIRDTALDAYFTTTIAVTALPDGTLDYRTSCPSTLLVTGATNRSGVDTDVERLGKSMADPDSLVQSTNELFGKYPDNAPCSYPALARRNEVCEHLAAALTHLQAQHTDLAELLEQRYVQMTTAAEPGENQGGSAELAYLERFIFHVPVLIEGDRGGGKTYDGYALARKYSLPVVLAPGHEGVEAADLLGYTVQAGAHGFVWMDGPVTQAFRKAKAGKVLLVLDELLRIPQRHLSALLTTLTPDEHAGVYRLPTGRVVDVVDGVGVSEVLECPIENLLVLATTNVGAEYAVDECDPALRERFHVIRRDTEDDRLRSIIAAKVAVKGWPAHVVANVMDFFGAMNRLKTQNNIKAAPTTRTLTRAVALARSPNEVGEMAYEMGMQWVARSPAGKPVQEQLELVRKAVNKAFSINIPAPKSK